MNLKNQFLNAAERIGDHICETALWYKERCTWIGSNIEPFEGIYTRVDNSLGPEIYDGTSGIALFLLYLNKIRTKEIYSNTIKAAINQAIAKIDDHHSSNKFSFYSGRIGIVYALAKVGIELKRSDYIEKSIEIFDNLFSTTSEYHLQDFISGNAGSIPILIQLYKQFNNNKILELAINLGNELISSKYTEKVGCSWGHKVNGIEEVYSNLTGFSHGVAGIVYALLKLYQITDNKEYLNIAEQGISYEDQWYNTYLKNWPDFRNIKEQQQQSNRSFSYADAWCHGSPGIILSRLLYYEISNDKNYLDTISAVLDNISNKMKNEKYLQSNNFSLCHGIAGNCEALIYGNCLLGKNVYMDIVINAALYGITTYKEIELWPCGNQLVEAQTPGLMVGLSGIGYFYLRLYNHKIPSILAI
jgi:type 2 lantibiotic biosynthesis protein LanM